MKTFSYIWKPLIKYNFSGKPLRINANFCVPYLFMHGASKIFEEIASIFPRSVNATWWIKMQERLSIETQNPVRTSTVF